MTTSPHVSARPAEGAQPLANGRWLMLIILLGGQFMALLDVTIVNVAMPTIGRALHASGAATTRTLNVEFHAAAHLGDVAGTMALRALHRCARRSLAMTGRAHFLTQNL